MTAPRETGTGGDGPGAQFAHPLVSVIVPCRNEGKRIAPCLDSILANDYPGERLEVLVVDGMSSDETRSVVERYSAGHACIRLLDNTRQITPAALNIGIAAAHGTVIVRMDAHVDYPADYIRCLVQLLDEKGADNVGGVCLTQPGGDTAMARAIAVGMSHPAGVGNSYFRIGSAEERWVDTVPFGCYRKEVFQRIGLFDEELVRNQDDEFNLRLIRSGGRILLAPQVVCRYYARDSLGKLWRMYYQYGYFKPLVVRKVKGVMTFRQLAPPLLVLCLVAGGLLAPWSRLAAAGWASLALCYLAALSAFAVPIAVRHGLSVGFSLTLVFLTLHVSYGVGYLRGVLDYWILRKRVTERNAALPISR
jgi:glycosyltransferase involved in cell wall biosynthesis